MACNYLVTFVFKFAWGEFKSKGILVEGKPMLHFYDAMKAAGLTAPDSIVRHIEKTSGRKIAELITASERGESCKLYKWKGRFLDLEQLRILMALGYSDFSVEFRRRVLAKSPKARQCLIKF